MLQSVLRMSWGSVATSSHPVSLFSREYMIIKPHPELRCGCFFHRSRNSTRAQLLRVFVLLGRSVAVCNLQGPGWSQSLQLLNSQVPQKISKVLASQSQTSSGYFSLQSLYYTFRKMAFVRVMVSVIFLKLKQYQNS